MQSDRWYMVILILLALAVLALIIWVIVDATLNPSNPSGMVADNVNVEQLVEEIKPVDPPTQCEDSDNLTERVYKSASSSCSKDKHCKCGGCAVNIVELKQARGVVIDVKAKDISDSSHDTVSDNCDLSDLREDSDDSISDHDKSHEVMGHLTDLMDKDQIIEAKREQLSEVSSDFSAPLHGINVFPQKNKKNKNKKGK